MIVPSSPLSPTAATQAFALIRLGSSTCFYQNFFFIILLRHCIIIRYRFNRHLLPRALARRRLLAEPDSSTLYTQILLCDQPLRYPKCFRRSLFCQQAYCWQVSLERHKLSIIKLTAKVGYISVPKHGTVADVK